MHRKVLHTSYAIKKTFRIRMRIRAQSKCCKSNQARRESLASKTLSCALYCFVWFCTCVVLYLYGFVLVWFVLVWFVLVWFVLVWFVLVWFVLVWFVLVWFCICMVLYLYGFILFLLRPCGGGCRQYSKELRMKQFSHIMKCERLRLLARHTQGSWKRRA